MGAGRARLSESEPDPVMTELAQLQVTGLFTYNGDYTNTWGWDSTHDWGTRNQAGTRALGGLQWLGGNLQTVGGVAAGTTCETGFGCFAAGYLVTTGYDNANAGFATMVSGTSVPTWGGQVLQGLGLSSQSAELLYGVSQIGVALAPAIKTNVSSLLASRGTGSIASPVDTPIATATTDVEAGGTVGLKGKAIDEYFNHTAAQATHNDDALEVVLGKYIPDSLNSYDEVARSRGATYFSMGDWNVVSGEVGETQMWEINRSFLDQQMAKGKTFLFTSDPYKAISGSFTQKELNYLVSKGYNVVKDSGGMYRAVK